MAGTRCDTDARRSVGCQAINVQEVVPLPGGEVYRGQVFHDGLLWEGHSTGTVDDYRLDVLSADGCRTLASAPVPHTLEFLYPFGPGTILAVGKHSHPRRGWRTHHTTAKFSRGRLAVRTRTMPINLQVEQFGGGPGRMYFNETGTRRVFRWNGWWARSIGPDIHLPGVILPFDRYLFVLERNCIFPGLENIAKIDLATHLVERTFDEVRNHLSTMINLEGFPWIAVAETRADQVLLIDRESNTLAATLSAPGLPIALACLGRCLVVLCREPKCLLFFDLASPHLPLVAQWDLDGLGDDFCNVTTMHVDPRGGSVFLRSPFHPRFPDNAPGVKRVWEPSGETLRFCWSDPGSGHSTRPGRADSLPARP